MTRRKQAIKKPSALAGWLFYWKDKAYNFTASPTVSSPLNIT